MAATTKLKLRDASIHVRIDSKLKSEATIVLMERGISVTEAVELFLKQIVVCRGLPFQVMDHGQKFLQDLDGIQKSLQEKIGDIPQL